VSTAAPSVEIAPAETVKSPEATPAGMVTDGGTASSGALLESVTETPPAGAGLGSDAVQVAVEPEARLAGTQLSDARISGPVNEIRKL